ncbi:MAG: tyrosine--tRNA ligase [Candidatus Entotheonellia bacterium]
MSIDDQISIIQRGAVDLLTIEELRRKLERSATTGQPLRVKLGLDPTAPDIHLGHTVVLHKLRQFQELGHQVCLVIGDFTGMIGDPTGKSETRKPLTRDDILANAQTYAAQLYKVLEPAKTTLRFNSEWLGKLTPEEIVTLAAKYTVARMLERDDFQRRFHDRRAISVHEFLYPLFQAYDSVALQADVELGGTDQKFNLLVGRDIQREYGQEPQVIVTTPLLEGLDGVQKMSKSLGNYIGITEPPREIYGKIMSLSDQLMLRYYELLSGLQTAVLEEKKRRMGEGSVNPRDVKMALAREMVTRFYNGAVAEEAEREFQRMFQGGGLPDDVDEPLVRLSGQDSEQIWIVALLVQAGLVPSNSEARRLIQQGAVRVDGERVSDANARLTAGESHLLQVGRRRFARIRPENVVRLS